MALFCRALRNKWALPTTWGGRGLLYFGNVTRRDTLHSLSELQKQGCKGLPFVCILKGSLVPGSPRPKCQQHQFAPSSLCLPFLPPGWPWVGPTALAACAQGLYQEHPRCSCLQLQEQPGLLSGTSKVTRNEQRLKLSLVVAYLRVDLHLFKLKPVWLGQAKQQAA